MIKSVRKIFYILILTIFISGRIFVPFTVFADDSSLDLNPTPTPTETIVPTSDSTLSPPSDEPSPSPTLQDSTCSNSSSPDTSSTNNIDSNGCINNNVNSQADSGNNSISTPSASLDNSNNSSGAGTGSSVSTSDSVSTAVVDNNVNNTSINSETVFQTINLFIDSDQNIDLSTPFQITKDIITKDNNNDPVVNVRVTGVDTYSYLSNDISSVADSGKNNIDGKGNISTGNAYSVVSLLNKVNFTVVNSKVHVVTINIFGDLNGNIILPDLQNNSGCVTCGMFLNTDSNAVVSNNVNSEATSGENTIVSTGSSSIDSGNSKSSVSLINIVNTNVVGVNIAQLYINVLGGWDGSFLGWGNLGSQNAGNLLLSLVSQGGSGECQSCISDLNLNLNSTAVVNNSINSFANSGGNNINGKGNINTGNAYSAISLLNFVNANFINSWGFFGFINIFGHLKGNIGDQKAFVTSESNSSSNNSGQGESSPEKGGKLYIEQKNNTGEYVLPGDTVTFFINTRNTGSGKVYDPTIHLYLFKDGKNVGGHDFPVGEIPIGRGVNLTTGFVLSDKIPGGEYIARASVEGKTGDDPNLSAISDSTFSVNGNYAGNIQSLTLIASDKDVKSPVLSVQDNPSDPKNDSGVVSLLLTLGSMYLILRILRKREDIKYYFKNLNRNSFKANLYGIKMFLL